jgi:hypothetical protein
MEGGDSIRIPPSLIGGWSPHYAPRGVCFCSTLVVDFCGVALNSDAGRS